MACSFRCHSEEQQCERTTGFEPATSTLARWCSSQLSYVRKTRQPMLSVRDTGIEPVTSSVSGKRATAAPIAPKRACKSSVEVGTGFEPAYTALQAAASPLGHPTVTSFLRAGNTVTCERTTGFEPATSTLARWCSSQLSYVRMLAFQRRTPAFQRRKTL